MLQISVSLRACAKIKTIMIPYDWDTMNWILSINLLFFSPNQWKERAGCLRVCMNNMMSSPLPMEHKERFVLWRQPTCDTFSAKIPTLQAQNNTAYYTEQPICWSCDSGASWSLLLWNIATLVRAQQWSVYFITSMMKHSPLCNKMQMMRGPLCLEQRGFLCVFQLFCCCCCCFVFFIVMQVRWPVNIACSCLHVSVCVSVVLVLLPLNHCMLG